MWGGEGGRERQKCRGGREKRVCRRGTRREGRRVREGRREKEARVCVYVRVCMCMFVRHTHCWRSCQHIAYMWRPEDLQWVSGSSSFHFIQDKVSLLLLKPG